MGKTTISKLYNVLVRDTQCPASAQRRILTVGKSHNDGGLLASLAGHRNLPEEIDKAIGDRTGAKERAAWISRKSRTAEEVRGALKSEKRFAVLQAAAQRQDLGQRDYSLIVSRGNLKVLSEIIKNPSVSDRVKQEAAAEFGSRFEADDSISWRTNYELAALFDGRSSLHEALVSRTDNRDVLCYAAGGNLCEATQLKILDKTLKPFIERMETPGVMSWDETSNVRRMSELIQKISTSKHTTALVRQTAKSALESSVFVKTDQYRQRSQSVDSSRVEMISVLDVPPTATGSDSAVDARTSCDGERLMELAEESRTNQALSHALFDNPSVTVEAARIAVHGLGWRGIKEIAHTAAQNERADIFAVVAAHYFHEILDDGLLAKFSSPEDALTAVAAEMVLNYKNGDPSMRSRMERYGGTNLLLQSRYCTNAVILQMPVSVLATEEAPAHVASIVTRLLDSELGDEEKNWELFEALVGDGTLPLGETIEAVKALGS